MKEEKAWNSPCMDGYYWWVQGGDFGKRPSPFWDHHQAQWHTGSDLQDLSIIFIYVSHLKFLRKRRGCDWTIPSVEIKQPTDWENMLWFSKMIKAQGSSNRYTCHVVVGMIPAWSFQRIRDGEALLVRPEPFQIGEWSQVPFTQALLKVTDTEPSWRHNEMCYS